MLKECRLIINQGCAKTVVERLIEVRVGAAILGLLYRVIARSGLDDIGEKSARAGRIRRAENLNGSCRSEVG